MAGHIYREKKTNDFVILGTRCLRDAKLKWDAKGLHSYVMQLPDDWRLNIADLQQRSANGRDGTNSPMNALIEAGYVVRQRAFDGSGKFSGYDYHVFEHPEQAAAFLELNGKTVNGKTVNGKTVNGKTVNGKTVTNKGLSQESIKVESIKVWGNEARENALTLPPVGENDTFGAKKENEPSRGAAGPSVLPFAAEGENSSSGAGLRIDEGSGVARQVKRPEKQKAAPREVEIPESHEAVRADLTILLRRKEYLAKSEIRLAREMTWLFSKPLAFVLRHVQDSNERRWAALDFNGCEEAFLRWQKDEQVRASQLAANNQPSQSGQRMTGYQTANNPAPAYAEASPYRRLR